MPKLLGAAGIGAIANQSMQPNVDEQQFEDSFDAFQSTFPRLHEPDARKLHKKVWDKYQLQSDQQQTKYLIQGAGNTQRNKYSSLTKLGFRRNEDV